MLSLWLHTGMMVPSFQKKIIWLGKKGNRNIVLNSPKILLFASVPKLFHSDKFISLYNGITDQ